jgi:uncharacterized protein
MNVLFAILIAAIPTAGQLEKSCSAGKGAACDELGNRYRLSLGVKPSETKAADAYKAACRHKDPDGCADDAFAKAIGLGQARDPAAAGKLETQCKAGVARACGRLGHLLVEGISVTENRERGETLMTDACKAGDLESCTNMSIISWQIGDFPRSEKFGHAACDNGDAEGCATIADFYLTRRDLVQAAVNFTQACDLGSTRGCRGQALMLLQAGTDKPKSLKLLDHNCSLGDKPSCEAARTARDEKPSTKPKPK